MAKIVGKEQLLAKFRAMPAAVRQEVTAGVQKAAQDLVAMQKRLVRRKTGALAESIRFEVEHDGQDAFRAVVMAGGLATTRREARKGSGQVIDEAVLVEGGVKPHIAGGKFKGAKHPGMAAAPFFYNSYRASKKRIKSTLSRSMTKGIKKVAGR